MFVTSIRMAEGLTLIPNAGPIVSGIIKVGGWGLGIIVFFIVLAIVLKFYKNKKAFNIPVTVWIPRSDNTIVDELTCRGGYFKSAAVGGVTSFRLKRKGLPVIDIPPPSSKFLVGLSRHLYLVQKGMDDFEAVIPKSFLYVTDNTGKQIPIVDLRCINQDATAWKFDNEETAKRRFTLKGFWEKYKDFIQMTIFIFIVFLAIYIMFIGLKDVVAGLDAVAKALQVSTGNAPIVG